jgi:hypothetical protein
VLEIRRFLTVELQSLDRASDLAHSLRAMRAACRKFMHEVGARRDIARFGGHRGHWASWSSTVRLGNSGGSSVFTSRDWRPPMVWTSRRNLRPCSQDAPMTRQRWMDPENANPSQPDLP